MFRRNLDEPVLDDSEMKELREDLFWELQTSGSVFILGHECTIFELLEDMDDEEKDNVFSMLVRGNDEAKEYAVKKLFAAFSSAYDDEVLEDHYIDEKTSF